MTGMLEALVEPAAGGGWTVRSPRVGIYRGCPRAGGRRMAGDTVGRLTVLDRSEDLLLPAGVDGLVTDIAIHDRALPVEYGQPLFTLAPVAAVGALPPSASPRGGDSLPEGCFAVTCPIDGVFYRRPSPAAPAYIEIGGTVEAGRTLGLIEAMKSFNVVAYGGPGLPAQAIIEEIRAVDAAEVRQGAVLFVVRGARPIG
jgi:acetyl-CoA carboxylase biotin carboxyl carrier protein